ncbi:MAG: NAD+ synthase [Pseudomonadota bacterium]|nr:NAD+ synthase [Pseudomonadota bacterium]
MTLTFSIALAQINPKVGDIDGNVDKMLEVVDRAKDIHGCRAVIFPELCVTGYPPEDLLLRGDFLDLAARGVERLRGAIAGGDIAILAGHPLREAGRVYNALSVIENGEIRALYRKRHLPNYGVFDEKRYFRAGGEAVVATVGGVRTGFTICEDIWEQGPVCESVAAGAELIVTINASPFHCNKAYEREEGVVRKRARENGVPIVYVNQVGGQDELVFDGSSLVVDAGGEVMVRLPAFEEAFGVVRFSQEPTPRPLPGEVTPHDGEAQRVYDAIVLGVRDYIEKNGFRGVVLGLSGGIDSALTLAMAVDAIGPKRVEAVMMPSRYTSEMSLEDARAEADALGVRYDVAPIEPIFRTVLAQLEPLFEGLPADATEENLQARIRGMLLMAISNKKGCMVLTTGNKSEMAVGYATLYGDMAGGYAAIKDVPKTLVYELARYRNRISPVIPERVITRPPSAELAPDQKDEDSLPPYEILDPILEAFVEQDKSPAEIVAMGFDAVTVERVVKMVVRNEYKRRQAAPGVRITPRAFGRDRRYPITSGFF